LCFREFPDGLDPIFRSSVPLVAADSVTVQGLNVAPLPELVSIDRDDDPALSYLDHFLMRSDGLQKLSRSCDDNAALLLEHSVEDVLEVMLRLGKAKERHGLGLAGLWEEEEEGK